MTRVDYYWQLYLAWTIRGAIVFSLVALLGLLGGCGHAFNMSGSIAKDPPSTTSN
jgi:hypothetical protein